MPFFSELNMVDIAQLVSASDCGSEGRGFESHYPPQKKKRHPSGCLFFFLGVVMGFEDLNTTCRWQVVRRRLDGGDTLIFAKGENAANPIIHPTAVFLRGTVPVSTPEKVPDLIQFQVWYFFFMLE